MSGSSARPSFGDIAICVAAFVAYLLCVTGGSSILSARSAEPDAESVLVMTGQDVLPPFRPSPPTHFRLPDVDSEAEEALRAHYASIVRPPLSSFVNFETPTVHPVDSSPDGRLLAVVNLPAGRVHIFDTAAGSLRERFSAPVGIDPVTVRFRNNHELWAVNHISDSISVIDVDAERVTAVIETGDEPCDVVFAGKNAARAFVTCSQIDTVEVYEVEAPYGRIGAIEVFGEDPRSLAVSPDGETVYAAIFESGNATTLLMGITNPDPNGPRAFDYPPNVVNREQTPYGGQNPPPNSGDGFNPPLNPANSVPPNVSLIVRKDAAGRWRDDNGTDWTRFVSGDRSHMSGRIPGWDMPDNDIAVIDANDLSVEYVTRAMTTCAALAVNPASGSISVVGTDARNEVRFEPVINGTFVRVLMALAAPGDERARKVSDLNPHLDYSTPTLPAEERKRAIGDPRAIVWRKDGQVGYIAGMGSNNVIAVSSDGTRLGHPPISVGEGPAGLALDEAAGRLYVLNRFENSISVVDPEVGSEIERIALFDPTPPSIKVGRKHLYNTHETSGLGHVSCASCHIDARTDRLAWDLGNPAGDELPTSALNKGFGFHELAPTVLDRFHPMKGPMTTQTMQDIIGKEPHHWMGDREGIHAFNEAFESLLGNDRLLTESEMDELTRFLASIHFPPNPYRTFDNKLSDSVDLKGHYTPGRFGLEGEPLPPGDAVAGLSLFRDPERLIGAEASCAFCHVPPAGLSTTWRWNGVAFVPPASEGSVANHGVGRTGGISLAALKTPQIRNMYDKTGFIMTKPQSKAGFGFTSDGAIDTLARFVSIRAFSPASDREVANLVALLLSFSGSEFPFDKHDPPGTMSRDAHAAVGKQFALYGEPTSDPRIDQALEMAAERRIGIVGVYWEGGEERRFFFDTGTFRTGEGSAPMTLEEVIAKGRPGAPVILTVVPRGVDLGMTDWDVAAGGTRRGERLAEALSAP